MESGLEGRNNDRAGVVGEPTGAVSMESGLEGRNNSVGVGSASFRSWVSMESGLEGRNNKSKLEIVVLAETASQWSPA